MKDYFCTPSVLHNVVYKICFLERFCYHSFIKWNHLCSGNLISEKVPKKECRHPPGGDWCGTSSGCSRIPRQVSSCSLEDSLTKLFCQELVEHLVTTTSCSGMQWFLAHMTLPLRWQFNCFLLDERPYRDLLTIFTDTPMIIDLLS